LRRLAVTSRLGRAAAITESGKNCGRRGSAWGAASAPGGRVAYRRELGGELFTSLLTQVADNTGLADTITSLLDDVDKTDGRTA